VAYYYAHNSANLVARGQRVARGQQIARVGHTGNARTTPPHIHFQINVCGEMSSDEPCTVDPRPHLLAWAQGFVDGGADGLGWYRPSDATFRLRNDAGSALPALSLRVTTATDVEDWQSVADLLESGPFDNHFVAEVDDDGRALLRFGDGQYGRSLDDVQSLSSVYRVGNGRAGNVGHDTISHVAPALSGAPITLVRNPMPARDGTDPETIEQARQLAPQAFHSELFRAVTEQDWVRAAERLPDVAGAAATYRWTGSWLTIFIAVDPSDRANLTDLPAGRTMLDPAFEQRVRQFITRYRLAGYDIELRAPRFVPVDLWVELCAKPGYFRSDVVQAVRDALSNRDLPDGSRGFFHPANFAFGQPLYVSRLYAAIASVPGVDSVAIRKLVRFGQTDAGELERGELDTGPWEIVRLDNDPSFVEHGVLTVTARGGKQ
jgi:hypothetical protein